MRLSYVQMLCFVGLAWFVRHAPPMWFALLVVLPLIVDAFITNRTRTTPLRDASVLVTGASSGLGRAMAVAAARRGARKVVLVARRREALDAVADEVRAANNHCEAIVVPCDVSSAESVFAMADDVRLAHGVPDIVVNNAGAGAWKHIENTTIEEARGMMGCPAMSTIYVSQAFAVDMVARGAGHFVQVTSAASMAGVRGAVVYGTARWTVRGFSRYLRADLADTGVGVTLVNAAEIGDTSYFADAPGKAGASSYDHIPWMFKLPIVRFLSYDSWTTASAAFDAMERGEHEVMVPWYMIGPLDVFARLLPGFFQAMVDYGPSARRSR